MFLRLSFVVVARLERSLDHPYCFWLSVDDDLTHELVIFFLTIFDGNFVRSIAINEWIIACHQSFENFSPSTPKCSNSISCSRSTTSDDRCSTSNKLSYRDYVPIHWLKRKANGHQRLFIILWWIYHNNWKRLFDWLVKYSRIFHSQTSVERRHDERSSLLS